MSDLPLKSKAMCEGCRNNYYNTPGPHGAPQCWSYKDAQVVRRWRIGWWTQPKAKSDFVEVVTLKCHSAPGKYADFAILPKHLTQLERRKI